MKRMYDKKYLDELIDKIVDENMEYIRDWLEDNGDILGQFANQIDFVEYSDIYFKSAVCLNVNNLTSIYFTEAEKGLDEFLALKQNKLSVNSLINEAVVIDRTIITGVQTNVDLTNDIQTQINLMLNNYSINYGGAILTPTQMHDDELSLTINYGSIYFDEGYGALLNIQLNKTSQKFTSYWVEV